MGELTENLSAQKLRGGYYTPKLISEFICKWGINEETYNVLEPSCGDGVFIESALKRFNSLNIKGEELQGRVKGIELINEEAYKADKKTKEFGIKNAIVNSDFFHYTKKNIDKKYDLIIGNPPFIRYQNFPEEHREIAIEMMRQLGLKPNRLTNIWVPFLVISASLLNDKGKLGMVIPAELFQVQYAGETRIFLSKFFERITIVTFKKLVFKGIQQEVVLLLCEKKVKHSKGIRVLECEDLDDLEFLDFAKINNFDIKPIDHSTEKWTKYFLNVKEINLLKRLKNDERIISCEEVFDTNVGLVTGRNEFFMLNKQQVEKWNLEEFTIPVASRSNQLKGLSFSEKDFLEISEEQKSVYLFLPPDVDFKELPKVCQEYIKYGEEEGFNRGYKTRIRKRWYITPSRWVPDGFALRQVGGYTKIILNETGASSTDTIHRVKFVEGVNKKIAAVSFLNSLTLAYSEVTGRSYGGGVLTFEPSEMRELKIPIFEGINIDFSRVDTLMRQQKIEEVLDIVDEILLIDYHGFTRDEVMQLRNIWKKLSQRRNNRKQ